MGGAGDPPAPVGDPPTGTARSNLPTKPARLVRWIAAALSGESPDGTGGSPVLPSNDSSKTREVGSVDAEGMGSAAPTDVGAPVRRALAPNRSRNGQSKCFARARAKAGAEGGG